MILSKEYLVKFANLLINYCLAVKEKEIISISGPVAAIPLIEQIYIQLLKQNAYPLVRLNFDNQEELFFKYAKKYQLENLPEIILNEAKKIDGIIRIMGSSNTKGLSEIEPEKQAKYSKTMEPVKEEMINKNRWVLTLYPTQSYAQDAEMSLESFQEFVVSALFLDKKDPIKEWQKIEVRQEKIVKFLNKADNIKIISNDTNLTLSVKGRKFMNSCGKVNMPSGEVFTGPIENSANGYIKFSFPACYAGREVDGVYLEFENGKVIKAKADKNEDFLLTLLNTDVGSKYLGEFAFGTNYGIKRFIKNILFDEKIGGSIHLAIGSSYPQTGGKNKSAIHWDFIKDFRTSGEVYVDDRLFLKKGKIYI
ncbi:MAG TPA: aminopeptidase [bacterium]|nr:aminopeptidase [bacterium]HOL47839.1 aminopeptidase [bacterium]HPQ19552.1 aminopeptidase [bacterium]